MVRNARIGNTYRSRRCRIERFGLLRAEKSQDFANVAAMTWLDEQFLQPNLLAHHDPEIGDRGQYWE